MIQGCQSRKKPFPFRGAMSTRLLVPLTATLLVAACHLAAPRPEFVCSRNPLKLVGQMSASPLGEVRDQDNRGAGAKLATNDRFTIFVNVKLVETLTTAGAAAEVPSPGKISNRANGMRNIRNCFSRL